MTLTKIYYSTLDGKEELGSSPHRTGREGGKKGGGLEIVKGGWQNDSHERNRGKRAGALGGGRKPGKKNPIKGLGQSRFKSEKQGEKLKKTMSRSEINAKARGANSKSRSRGKAWNDFYRGIRVGGKRVWLYKSLERVRHHDGSAGISERGLLFSSTKKEKDPRTTTKREIQREKEEISSTNNEH